MMAFKVQLLSPASRIYVDVLTGESRTSTKNLDVGTEVRAVQAAQFIYTGDRMTSLIEYTSECHHWINSYVDMKLAHISIAVFLQLNVSKICEAGLLHTRT